MVNTPVLTSNTKRTLKILSFVTLLLCISSPEMYAEGGVGGAIESVTTQISGYVGSVQKLIYAIAGIVGLVGGLSIYVKMNNEDQDVKKSIMMVVGACIFLIAFATALPLFFQ